ncbi:hypothetical protein J4411_00325 [Candidatus Pacearchaeota archaeon]|nr:hypothetical protein [Candidatus Pacearchaeota archaeon]
MEEVYLKCNYFPGMFSNKYFVDFRGSEFPKSILGGLYVLGEFLIKEDDSSGLVKVIVIKEEETANILVQGAIDERRKVFTVLNEDLIFGETS